MQYSTLIAELDGHLKGQDISDAAVSELKTAVRRVQQLEQAYEYVLVAYLESELSFIGESSSTITEDEARLTSECDDLARRHLGKGIAEVRT